VTNYFAAQGSSLAQASQQAIAWIGKQVQTQASFLAYMDAFWVLMLISLSTKFWVAVGQGLVSQIIRREVERRARQDGRSLARSKNSQSPPNGTNSPISLTSRDLLRLVDRIFRSRFLRSGLLPWHYSRIRNHFRDVDRL